MEVLIIGNGIAGNEVASSLRAYGGDGAITCLSAEPYPEYDPCALTYFVGGDVNRECVFRKRDGGIDGVRLLFGERATNIDPSRHTVSTEKGTTYRYDSLVLAHGGNLFVPPIQGVQMPGVFACKQLGDADALSSHTGSSAVVIGSGAIGIEAAEALKKRGYEVRVVELLDWILPTLFDEPAARILEQQLVSAGIAVHCGEKVLRIEGSEKVEKVVTNKQEIRCDTVVLATGVVPGVALARTAGIDLGRGIKVDRRMRTSVTDIYACGDCVETIDVVTGQPCLYQLKHNAIEQARIAAKSILGMEAVYAGAYPFARLHFFDTHSVTFGLPARSLGVQPDVEIIERSTSKGYLRLILKSGKLLGGQAVGEIADKAGILIGAMLRGDDFNQLRAEWPKIAMLGSPWPWQYRVMGRLCGLSSLGAS